MHSVRVPSRFATLNSSWRLPTHNPEEGVDRGLTLPILAQGDKKRDRKVINSHTTLHAPFQENMPFAACTHSLLPYKELT